MGLVAAVGAPARRAQARVPHYEEPRLDEDTALTLGGETLKLGILAFDYGITDRVVIGSSPPFWLVRSVESVLVPNLHVKVVAYRDDRLWLTGNVAFFYADVSTGGTSGSLYVAPLSAFASYRIQPRVWLHGEATYNMVFASGSGDLRKTTLGGTAAAQSVQLGLMGEYRIRPDIAITLRGRLQVFTSKLAVSGTSNPDAFTSLDVDARLTPHDSYPWEIVPGVSFLWTRVRLSAGVGYGNYFVPNIDIARGTKSIVPEANFALLF